VAIATFRSENKKTGPMIQLWIIRSDISPLEAARTGADVSICGDCPFRGIIVRVKRRSRNVGRGCYVELGRSPTAVYYAFIRGSYPAYQQELHAKYFVGRKIRLGAYGDPVCVPLPAVKPVLRLTSRHTGYSHQWNDRRFQRWSKYVMASVHSPAEAMAAHNLGWRSFRVKRPNAPVLENEIVCPASAEQNNRLTCEQCCACAGGRPTQRSVAIDGHGSPAILPAVYQVTV